MIRIAADGFHSNKAVNCLLSGILRSKESTLPAGQVNKRLSRAWYRLYDLCPELLKIDPPDGLTILCGFIHWASEMQAALDWTLHLNLYRWLLISPFRHQVTDEHLEVLMDASVAYWASSDDSRHCGILLTDRSGEHVALDWKNLTTGTGLLERPSVVQGAKPDGDFAYALLSNGSLKRIPRWRPLSVLAPTS